MKSIKAIETIYNGYRFRSRLEARWAVYFDSLDIKYEYEHEGYQLPTGDLYLPDFVLPELDVHVEVKPNGDLTFDEMHKIVNFVISSGKELLLIVGSPTDEMMFLIDPDHASFLSEEMEVVPAYQDEVELRGLFFESSGDYCHVAFGVAPRCAGLTFVYKSIPPNDDYRLHAALLEAKQARFEHGETGRRKR